MARSMDKGNCRNQACSPTSELMAAASFCLPKSVTPHSGFCVCDQGGTIPFTRALSLDQSSAVLTRAHGDSLRAKRDYAMRALLLGCGWRRSELIGLETGKIQTRQGHWAIIDLIGKAVTSARFPSHSQDMAPINRARSKPNSLRCLLRGCVCLTSP